MGTLVYMRPKVRRKRNSWRVYCRKGHLVLIKRWTFHILSVLMEKEITKSVKDQNSNKGKQRVEAVDMQKAGCQ